jgi:hypothetical protein
MGASLRSSWKSPGNVNQPKQGGAAFPPWHDTPAISTATRYRDVGLCPPGRGSAKADEAVLLGGPVGKVPDLVQDHTGADPLPANAAAATTGTIATVAGKQFRINAVDTADG